MSVEEIHEIRERVAKLEARQEDLINHVSKNTERIDDLHRDIEQLREKLFDFLDWKKIIGMVVAIVAAILGVGVAA